MPKKDVENPKLGERVTALETDITWIKSALKTMDTNINKIDKRLWWVLGSVVVLGIIAIAVATI